MKVRAWLLLSVFAIAALLAGCDDAGIRVFSDKTTTEVIVVSQTGGVFEVLHPSDLDVDGDGVVDSKFTLSELKVLQEGGWNIEILQEDRIGESAPPAS